MTHDQAPRRDTATETHNEPHGSASPHGAADDVPAQEHGGGNRVGQDGHGAPSPGTDSGHAADAGHTGGHDDEHGHGEALGPIDVQAWGAGALGVLLGLVVVACLVLATNGLHAG